MNVLEKIVADYVEAQTDLRQQLIAPVKEDSIRELVASVDPRNGELSFSSEGEPVSTLRLSEIAAVKSLIASLTKTAS